MNSNLPTACMRCGRCCTSFGVCITLFDIKRIAEGTGLKPIEFVTFTPEPPERERTEPAILLEGKYSLLILKWKPKKGRVCKFYDENSGLCSIYNSRPTLCRTYPFKLKNNRLVDVKSRACPVLWIPEEAKQYITDLETYKKELKKYKKIVDFWNSNATEKDTLEDFLRFALNKY
ncbi:YkgJ family cysteine cluster protein [Candidatus Micrarchaeota archaeon]|nr:YkgJ family cysteine cluster protein [Candidatus Micrarchaeota archaeon]